MFVLTIDQKSSRTGDDLVPALTKALSETPNATYVRGPERTIGDELQTATNDAATALAVILRTTRTRRWSCGLGLGDVEEPLPASIRAARGPAFIHARTAVDRAKNDPSRLAVAGGPDAADTEALLRLLIDLRDRRSPRGWEVYDAVAAGRTQGQLAQKLHISAAAVSLRAKAGGLRVEEQAVPALLRQLERAHAAALTA